MGSSHAVVPIIVISFKYISRKSSETIGPAIAPDDAYTPHVLAVEVFLENLRQQHY